MIIGVPKEIKNLEFRVGLTPTSVRELTARGAQVLVERGAGEGSGFGDDAYLAAGAALAADATEVFERADLIVKVKEPQTQECALLREGQILFTYLHLAAGAQIADALMASGCTADRRCLRDRDRHWGPSAPAHPHERGRGSDVGSGWCPLPGKSPRRIGCAAGRCPGSRTG